MSTSDTELVAAPVERTKEELAELDVCPTPPELALAICERVKSSICPSPLRILEPSAGAGVFVAAARSTWREAQIAAIEIRPECENALRAAGAGEVFPMALEAFNELYPSGVGPAFISDMDLVIGNPPFSLAEVHIRLLLAAMKPGAVLAFLLKLSMFESHKRVAFWREFPEDSFSPIVPRPEFKLNAKGKRGTDSQAYGLFVWTARGAAARTALALRQRGDHIVWREEKAAKPRKKRAPAVNGAQGNGAPAPEAVADAVHPGASALPASSAPPPPQSEFPVLE